jgi:hypothetical protein
VREGEARDQETPANKRHPQDRLGISAWTGFQEVR